MRRACEYKNVKKYKYISTANEKSLYFFKLSLHTLMRLYILNIVVFKSAAVRFEVCALCSAGYFLLYFFGFRASASSLCLLSWDKIRCPPPWFFAFGVPAMLIRWTIPFLVLTNMKCPLFALSNDQPPDFNSSVTAAGNFAAIFTSKMSWMKWMSAGCWYSDAWMACTLNCCTIKTNIVRKFAVQYICLNICFDRTANCCTTYLFEYLFWSYSKLLYGFTKNCFCQSIYTLEKKCTYFPSSPGSNTKICKYQRHVSFFYYF